MSKKFLDYYIVVEARDREEINEVAKLLFWFIEKKENVPYEIVQKFLQFLDDQGNFLNRKMDTESAEKATIAAQRLAGMKSTRGKKKDYTFEYKEPDGTLVTFEEILRRCIRAYLQGEKEDEPKSKEEVMLFFFEVINNHFKPKLTIEEQARLNTYSVYVMVGVLTEVCWTKITSRAKPTPEALYDAVKYKLDQARP